MKKGVPGASAWTAESDQYFAQAEMMRTIGCEVATGVDREFQAISANDGPRIVIDASTALFSSEYSKLFPFPQRINITARSTLVVQGDVVVEALDLDGAFVAKAATGHKLRVVAKGEQGRIVNEGHVLLQAAADDSTVLEVTRMRGFTVQKLGETVVDTASAEEEEQRGNNSSSNGRTAGGKSEFVYAGGALVHAHLFEEESSGPCKCFC